MTSGIVPDSSKSSAYTLCYSHPVVSACLNVQLACLTQCESAVDYRPCLCWYRCCCSQQRCPKPCKRQLLSGSASQSRYTSLLGTCPSARQSRRYCVLLTVVWSGPDWWHPCWLALQLQNTVVYDVLILSLRRSEYHAVPCMTARAHNAYSTCVQLVNSLAN